MKVLMISGDPEVLDPDTETGKRVAEYRQVLGEIDVLLAYGNVFRFLAAFFAGLKILRREKYDVITAQGPEHYLLAWIFSKISGVPWQMQIHTDIFSSYFVQSSVLNKTRVWLTGFLLPKASCVRVVSERIKNSILRTSDVLKDVRRPIVVLPIFTDVEKIKNALIKTDLHKKYPGRFIILMASRITKEKNIGLAIEAMKALKAQVLQDLAQRGRREQSNSPAGEYASLAKLGAETPMLLIVGDGPECEALKLQTINYKLQTSVIFESHTTDLASYYKTCDLFLLASNYEGYGRTLVEATAAGVKIISSDVGIAREILELDAIFKVGDKEDLKSKIAAALQGNLSFPKPPAHQTKEEYLRLYKQSFEICSI